MKNVTYLEHSGFLVELDSCYLLFDYVKGELPPLKRKTLYVFVSHAHADHYQPMIFDIQHAPTTYIIANDVDITPRAQMYLLAPYTTLQIDDMRIRTLKSTDEGVAYLVHVDGVCVYHAGDLHWWHWEEENSDEENEQAKQAYINEIQSLAKEKIDIAFVVVDPRQEKQYTWGLQAFLQICQAQYVFPMHVWGDYHCISTCLKEVKEAHSSLMKIHHPQEEFSL